MYDGFVRIADKVKHGFGTFKWSTGQIYQVDSCRLFASFARFQLTVPQGEWRNDSQNGKGLWTFPSGQVYYGELRNGLYHGRGCIKFSNGNACFCRRRCRQRGVTARVCFRSRVRRGVAGRQAARARKVLLAQRAVL